MAAQTDCIINCRCIKRFSIKDTRRLSSLYHNDKTHRVCYCNEVRLQLFKVIFSLYYFRSSKLFHDCCPAAGHDTTSPASPPAPANHRPAAGDVTNHRPPFPHRAPSKQHKLREKWLLANKVDSQFRSKLYFWNVAVQNISVKKLYCPQVCPSGIA